MARGRPRMLPEGLALGVPTRYWPVARSGILGWTSSLRLLLDVVAPRPDVRRPLGDRAIGPLVARKLGPGVVGTLVDPLVGGIHAGSVADMSAAAVYPLLLAVAQRRGSFMRALRRASAAQEPAPAAQRAEPAFWALRGGMGSLVARLAQRLGDRGVSVRVAAHVEKLSQVGGRAWVLHTSTGELAADAIVLAVPATSAASLLEPHEPEAAMLLRGVEHSSVAVVTMAYTARSLPATLRGTGLLVPAGTPAPEEVAPDGRFLVTACTYLSAKWPHLAAPDRVLVRASVGRHGDDRPSLLDDEALSARTARELRLLLGATGDPTDWHVTRWPDAFPQYRVHHLLRVAGIDAAVRRLPPLAVAGATYRGVGIPACVAGGRSAARQVLDALVRPGEVERSG
ncbi:MAG TPA: protoporphyrinogen oxidase [Acidimicrobiales bacterium]|nr:protoporphyrinogen oxidase [Acidimicrobiales bacterium]